MREWDPIGVSGIPEAADEYDRYVGTVYVMLMDHRATAEAIATYLLGIATRHMGLSAHTLLVERSSRAATISMSDCGGSLRHTQSSSGLFGRRPRKVEIAVAARIPSPSPSYGSVAIRSVSRS